MVNHNLIVLGPSVSATISPSRIDHDGAGHEMMAVLDAGLGDCHHPSGILIGAGLERELVVETCVAPAPRTPFCELTDGVLKPSVTISTPCRPEHPETSPASAGRCKMHMPSTPVEHVPRREAEDHRARK